MVKLSKSLVVDQGVVLYTSTRWFSRDDYDDNLTNTMASQMVLNIA